MEIGKRVPGIEPALCRLRDLRLYRSLHEEVSSRRVIFVNRFLSGDSCHRILVGGFSTADSHHWIFVNGFCRRILNGRFLTTDSRQWILNGGFLSDSPRILGRLGMCLILKILHLNQVIARKGCLNDCPVIVMI